LGLTVISIISYGRNDNYSYNLVKRTALAFNCLAEVLTNDDEILFTDYNTPDHLPTLPEFIWDTLTDKALELVKVVRISADVHQRIKKDSPLPILENVSRNAAIVRSNPKNHWILSTNPDVLLVLSSKWHNFPELLRTLKDSFYEMPRMDIPESVWSSLNRSDPKNNMRVLRDWLICHRAAVAETSPDWQFQKYILFDAPGDFQLAPRGYFMRMRGFDEAMNKYFHSDSNLAKRMWMLNGGRTDHLLGNLCVLHQDHYLSGEWAKTVTGIVHNDLSTHVAEQNKIEANGPSWGLRDVQLPTFSLCERITRERASFSHPPASVNGQLPMSQEVNWQTESFYRLCHYEPEVVALYLRETLRVTSPDSLLLYIGQNARMFELIRGMWEECSPSGSPVRDLSVAADNDEILSPDILLVDAYYERSDYLQKRIRLIAEQMERRLSKRLVTELQVAEEVGSFANGMDYQASCGKLLPLWEKLFSRIKLRPEALVIVMGCNMFCGLYPQLKEELAKCGVGVKVNPTPARKRPARSERAYRGMEGAKNHLGKAFDRLLGAFGKKATPETIQGVTLAQHGFRRGDRSDGPLDLLPLYIHHRLMVLRVSIAAGK
jgi:hypothetical protein